MLIYLVWDPHDCKLWLPENPPPLLLFTQSGTLVHCTCFSTGCAKAGYRCVFLNILVQVHPTLMRTPTWYTLIDADGRIHVQEGGGHVALRTVCYDYCLSKIYTTDLHYNWHYTNWKWFSLWIHSAELHIRACKLPSQRKSMRIISSTKNPQHNDLRVIDHRRFC